MTCVTQPQQNSGHDATSVMFPLVYDELKRLARHHRDVSHGPATLCTTELVHEAFLKLSSGTGAPWDDRAHFFGAASRAMRQVLVDFARRRQSDKRGGDLVPVTLQEGTAAIAFELDELLELDAALNALDAVDPRLRQIVELRFFAGLPEAKVAELLDVSVRTIGRDWMKARLFLLRELDATRATAPG